MVQRRVLGSAFLAALSVVVIFVIVYNFALINVNAADYFKYVASTTVQLANEKLARLLNADSLVNLPNVNLVTNNADIGQHQKCRNGAVRMSGAETDYHALCTRVCGTAGRVIEVHDGDEWYDNGKRLTTGAWCATATVDCNMRTGYVVATATGVVCETKYPNMFGGEAAASVVACHNRVYQATGSVLYDYLRNEPVDPLTVDMTHEDELLPDGVTYRFACKFSDDVHGNRYVANPLNRFHPMQNHCSKTLYRASRNVQLREDNDGWYCDCGEFKDTRVKHADESNRKSTCTSCYGERVAKGGGETIKVPYHCFTRNSKYDMAATEFPCAGQRFTENDGMCGTATFDVVAVKDGTEDTVMGMHSMPYANVDFYGEKNKIISLNWF